jgi:RNA polymerase-binding transcription factor DksA
MCSLCLPRGVAKKPASAQPDEKNPRIEYADLLRAHYRRRLAETQGGAQAPEVEREMREIRDAMERIYRGNYGICVSCEERIPEERLARIPQARCCVDCQSELETGRARGRTLVRVSVA